LATGHYNNEVIIWDYQTGKQITKLIDPGMLVAVFWSPDGSKLLESGLGALAYVWDTSTWKMLYQLSDIEPPSAYQSLDWSPDGSRILAGAGNDDAGAKDNTARIWDSRTGEQLLVVSSHTRMILSVDWSPDGSRFATASADGTTRIWDASTGSELLTLKTPSLYFEFVRWSPDGKHLVSGGTNSPPAVWRVWQSKEELIEYAKQCCVIRELTPEERQQFGLE
jgi:WD40 repeat protein